MAKAERDAYLYKLFEYVKNRDNQTEETDDLELDELDLLWYKLNDEDIDIVNKVDINNYQSYIDYLRYVDSQN